VCEVDFGGFFVGVGGGGEREQVRHDTQYNGIQYNDTQHEEVICDPQCNNTVIMLNVSCYLL
jgi:hypothetical protein